MEKLRQFIDWAEAHPKVWLDCVRIYLGLGLFISAVSRSQVLATQLALVATFLVAAIASLALITYVPAISLSLWSWLE